jgi:hypothetical protein
MELAAAGEDMKKLREIARVHIARCEAGDMQAIKELANRLDGRPAQILEHNGPDSHPIAKIVSWPLFCSGTRACARYGVLFRT